MTLRSMTAYGASEFTSEEMQVNCEVKSLNSRFLEVHIRLPRFLSMLETDLIQYVKTRLDRGKIEIYFDIRSLNPQDALPKVNESAVQHYLNCSQEILATYKAMGFAGDTPQNSLVIPISQMLKLDGVLHPLTPQLSALEQVAHYKPILLKLVEQAIDNLIQDREREGQSLHQVILAHLQALNAEKEIVAQMAPEITSKLQEHYFKRIETLKASLIEKGLLGEGDLASDRLTTELVILCDKIDVAEELDRLNTHIREFEDQLNSGDKIGRRLDFICQEMHREINTLSNKLVHAEVAKISVSMKQNVERVKQQIQNIE